MAYLNKVMLIGNLGKDPAVSVTQSGKKRISLSLVTSRRYRDNNGEQKEQTEWHNIVGWGKVADTMESLGVKKGTTLYVEGRIVTRGFVDRATNQQRTLTEIELETFQLLTPRNSNGLGQQTQSNSYSQQTNQLYNQQQVSRQSQQQTVNTDPGNPFELENGDGLPF